MTFLVRILKDDTSDVLYDMNVEVVPRIGDTITLRFPDRSFDQVKVERVDNLVDVKLGTTEITDDIVAVRVYVKQVTPPRQ